MAIQNHIYEISDLCFLHGVHEAVISPGSRSAPLTLAFVRNPNIKTWYIEDERSAAFFALGRASASRKTVVLICTSGTAALNYAPAIAEAFFLEVPLLVLTADRPPEWIHQYDGQTIYQENIYGNNVKKSFTLPVSDDQKDTLWHINRLTNEALNTAVAIPRGPVHINIPIREPFYPNENENYTFSENSPRLIKAPLAFKNLNSESWDEINAFIASKKRIMCLVGQNDENLDFNKINNKAVLVKESFSNTNFLNAITEHDFLSKNTDCLVADLIITFGKSIISKALKTLLRENDKIAHIHVQDNPRLIDTYQKLNYKIEVANQIFIDHIVWENISEDLDFMSYWINGNLQIKERKKTFLENVAWGQLAALHITLSSRNFDAIHVGNSMPVRYLNSLQDYIKSGTKVYANRGTSGIDGSVSTFLGQAFEYHNEVLCIIGDVSFFYDNNALFMKKLPVNFTILLINNGGGAIFKHIAGSKDQPELKDYFVGNQVRTAKFICQELSISYFEVRDTSSLENALLVDSPKVIECFTDADVDLEIFKDFMK